VRYCFYAALTVGIGALFSCFFFSVLWTWLFTIAYTIFYMFFGFYYIQYPRYFTYIQPVIYTPSNILDDVPKGHRRYVWEELRLQILEGKYYLHNGVNIEEMAHFLKIGRTSLSNFVNNDEGMSFNSWINFLRVEEAKILLLKNPDYNLAQIAEMVGYSESSNFSRQFKLFTRESPSVWRQQHKL
jgi:AraC-like DNA-binding protein